MRAQGPWLNVLPIYIREVILIFYPDAHVCIRFNFHRGNTIVCPVANGCAQGRVVVGVAMFGIPLIISDCLPANVHVSGKALVLELI